MNNPQDLNLRIYDFAVGGLPLSLRKLVKFELDGGKQQ